MALTVAEKEHWKERIGTRIEHRIETLVAKKDPTLLQRVAEQARERAYNSLGIFAQHVELQQIEKQKAELDRRERRLKAEQRAIIRGTPVEQEMEDGYYHENVVECSVTARAQALEADILSESELGKQILALRAEKDNLLDTVWLATSTSQVKELWEQVNSLLQITPSNLEDKALKIRPVQEE